MISCFTPTRASPAGSLRQAAQQGPFEAALLLGTAADAKADLNSWWQRESLRELLTVLGDGEARGRLCAEVPLDPR